MGVIRINTFGGIVPKLSAKLLPDNAAQTAHNCRLKSGRLEPLLQPAADTTSGRVVPAVTDSVKTMYLWRRGTSPASEWLTWNGLVGVAGSTLNDDDKARVWIAGATGVSSGATNNVPAVIGLSGDAKVERAVKKTAPAAPGLSVADIVSPSSILTWGCRPLLGIGSIGPIISIDPGIASMRGPVDASNNPVYETATNTFRILDDGLIEYTSSFTGFSAMWSYVSTYGLQAWTYNGHAHIVRNVSGTWTTIAPGDRINITATINDVPTVIGQAEVIGWRDSMNVVGSNAYHYNPISSSRGTVKLSTASFKVTLTLRLNYVRTGTGDNDWGYSQGAGVYRRYCQTVVDDWGQESPPSVASAEVFVAPGQQVTVQSMSGAANSKRRLYRVVSGTQGEDYRFVKEQDVSAGSFAAWPDNVLDEDAGEVMPVIENPPDDLDGLVNMPGGFLAGFRDKEVCFSAPWLPYSWPTEYRMTVDHNIVGLAVSGNDLYVLTDGYPYVLSGSHPETMTMAKLPYPQACSSRRSIVASQGWVFFASPDGMCGMRPGAALSVLTEGYYSRREWQALVPSSMLFAAHDDAIHVFSRTATADVALIIELRDGIAAITTNDENAKACFTDVVDDALYYVKGSVTTIQKWQGGTTNKTFKWRSKRFQSPQPENFSCARVTSDAYSLTLRVFASESATNQYTTEKASLSIASQKSRRLPLFRAERVFEVEVEHNSAIDDIVVASSMEGCRP